MVKAPGLTYKSPFQLLAHFNMPQKVIDEIGVEHFLYTDMEKTIWIHQVDYNVETAGPGLRTEVFLQGCLHGCRDCFSPSAQVIPTIPNGSYKCMSLLELTCNMLVPIVESNNNYLTVGGGEPILQAKELYRVMTLYDRACSVLDIEPHKILYTGYNIEGLTRQNLYYIKDLLKKFNVVIDGRFDVNEKVANYPHDPGREKEFVGSKNQRYIFLEEGVPYSFINGMTANDINCSNQFEKLFDKDFGRRF